MARLEVWAENAIKVVDEQGDGTARIRLLTTDGNCWATWERPFGDVEEWVQKADTVCNELAEEFAGEVQFMFVAESSSGTVRAQLPRRTMGRRPKSAGSGSTLMGDNSPAGALQKMYDAQAKTVEKTLQSANVQLEVLTRTVETQAKAHAELLEYIRQRNEVEAMEQKSSQQVTELVGNFAEQLPLLLEFLKMRKESKTAGAVGAVVEQVKASVTDAVADAAASAASNGVKALAGNAAGNG